MKYENWEAAPRGSAPPPGVPELVGRVLAARGITGEAEARAFLRTDAGLLHDPLAMRDMAQAAQRLEQAVRAGETVAVYGDYDVDGVTATCLLYHYLRARGASVLYYIPRRLESGYGLNRLGLDTLKDQGAQVVVTVDCGITAVEEVEYAKSLGMEVIVTDHHACKDILPAAVAVVDPHRPDCSYPFDGLAGVGVALKLAMTMGARYEDYADLAALGTVADVMPLVGENRAIVAEGLRQINAAGRPGIRALLEAAGADETVTAVTLGYTLAPRLNAAGRLGVTQVAVDLLLSETLAQAEPLARELCELNHSRQALEGEIFAQCVTQVETQSEADSAIVLHGEGWHQGVVGIVASRLTDLFQKPTFMISLQGGMGKGSCRGVEGLSLFEALWSAQDLLEGFGGHAMAAGFTVKEENIPALKERLNTWVAGHRAQEVQPRLQVDVALPDAKLLTESEVAALDLLEPFGAGNPKPVFTLSHACLTSMNRVGVEGKHMRLGLRSRSQHFGAIFFSCPKDCWDFRCDDYVDVAFCPQINEFRGKRSVQLVIRDIRRAGDSERREGELYRKYRAGAALTPGEASSLIPSRAEFEGLWRYLSAQAPVIAGAPVDMARRAAQSAGQPESLGRTLVGLEVFQERGLIVLAGGREKLRVTVLPRGPKVDLEESPILKRLHAWAAG